MPLTGDTQPVDLWWSTGDPRDSRSASRFEELPPPPPPPPPPVGEPGSLDPSDHRFRRTAIVAVAAALVGGLGGGAIVTRLGDQTSAAASAPTLTIAAPAAAGSASTGAGRSTADIAAAVLPSVVTIIEQAGQQQASGSGVVLDPNGDILTNNHVVSAAASGGSLTVQRADGTSSSATIVGRDPSSDLAVVRVSAVNGLKPATFGASSSIVVGDSVLAVGAPLGLSGTVTEGIVSAVQRPVHVSGDGSDTDAVLDAIQTDAAINPGNSGGALVNSSGQVIGITSAIASLGSSQGVQSGSIGVGFAIPSDEAVVVAKQLIAHGTASHAVIGVSAGGAASRGDGVGARIQSVQAGGPAASAGLRAGDVVTKVGDRVIDSADALVAAVRSHQPGETLTVTYTRSGSSRTATVRLGSATSG